MAYCRCTGTSYPGRLGEADKVALIISLTSSRTTPYIFFLRYFGINTIWYWHSHLQCAKLEPSIGRLLCFEFGLQHLAQYSTGGFYYRTPNTFSSSHPSLAGGLGLSFIFQMCENYYSVYCTNSKLCCLCSRHYVLFQLVFSCMLYFLKSLG